MEGEGDDVRARWKSRARVLSLQRGTFGWGDSYCGARLAFAIRTILAHRWFSLAIVATLALGIGLNTMVFTLVYAMMFKPVPVPVPAGSRLVIVTGTEAQTNRIPVSYPNFLDYQSASTSFEGLEAARQIGGVISETGIPPHNYSLEQVSSGLFDMLDVHPVLGRGFRASDAKAGAEAVVVLNYDVWKERYGSATSVIGRIVRVNTNPATIIRVMPEGFSFPSGVGLWMPLIPDADMLKRSNRSVDILGVLKPGISIERANVELKGLEQFHK